MRSEGYVEDLFVNTTGQFVREGEPLFRVYSKEIQLAQIDLTVATGAQSRMTGGLGVQTVEGAMQRLRNLAVPESRIQEVRSKGINPRTLDWPAPTMGTVIDKKIINGQRVMPGEELYRIADLSHLWVIADVAEADLSAIKIGTRATVMVRAYMAQPIEGEVTFVYPELKAETRTARVRIEVPNPDGQLKVDMYADVLFQTGAAGPVAAVPASAVIDSGTRQVVLVAKGEGRFEPRPVKLGVRGDGYVEVLEGVSKGEEVVTSATFLIDAESNLRAALQAFTQPEAPK
jgi:Cu(I)/Ag(I) efflux system membrane fusion protein